MPTNESRFADRLSAATYADDPLIGWISANPPAEAWIPDRLVDRLRLLGAAYSLHLLPLLPGIEPLSLNAVQVQNLIEEIDWLADRTEDPALREAVHDLHPVLAAAARGDGLRID